LTLEEIKDYRNNINEEIRLFGYSSFSLKKEIALGFAWENKLSGHNKVLFHIKYNFHGWQYFLDSGAYDYEEEVLLMDGIKVKVLKIEEVKGQNDDKVLYTLITLG